MTRESIEVKGRRYLAEGRLTVDQVGDSATPDLIVATCRGTDTHYRLGYDPRTS